MDGLRIFDFYDNKIRTLKTGHEIWWVLKDVCDALRISNPSVVASRLDSDEVTKLDLGGLSGESNLVNESGLYNVILRSDKPGAKKFKRWVTHEVIPSIRKHGAYMTPATIEKTLTDPDFIIGLATRLKESQAENAKLNEHIGILEPKAHFADSVAVSDDAILVGEMAKILKGNGVDTGEKRFYKQLRDDGFLIKRAGTDYNMPTQLSMERGLFKIKETAITRSNGVVSISKTPKITGKGQQFFINKYLKRQAVKA